MATDETQIISCVTLPSKISCIDATGEDAGNIYGVNCLTWIPGGGEGYPPGVGPGIVLFSSGPIDYVYLATTGNAQEFGSGGGGDGAGGNHLKALFGGEGGFVYVNFATKGNAMAHSGGGGGANSEAITGSSDQMYVMGGIDPEDEDFCVQDVDRTRISNGEFEAWWGGLVEGRKFNRIAIPRSTTVLCGGGWCVDAGGYLNQVEYMRKVICANWGFLSELRTYGSGAGGGGRAMAFGGEHYGNTDVIDFAGASGGLFAEYGNLSSGSAIHETCAGLTKVLLIGLQFPLGQFDISTGGEEVYFGALREGGASGGSVGTSDSHNGA